MSSKESAKARKKEIVEDIMTICNLKFKSSNNFELLDRLIYSLLDDNGVRLTIWYGRSTDCDEVMVDLLEKCTPESISDYLAIFTDVFFDEYTIYCYLDGKEYAFEVGYDGEDYRKIMQYKHTWKLLQDEELGMRLENSKTSSLGA